MAALPGTIALAIVALALPAEAFAQSQAQEIADQTAINTPREEGSQIVTPNARLWRADAFLHAAPAVLATYGVATGVGLSGSRRLPDLLGAGWFASMRLALNHSSEANRVWELDHYQVRWALGMGLFHPIGAGELFAQAGAGVLLLYEVRRQHQYRRLDVANVPGRSGHSWSVGPYAFVDLGAAITFYGPWSAVVSVGPSFTRQKLAAGATTALGWHGQVGVACAL